MTRPIAIIVTMALCAAVWVGIAQGAVLLGARIESGAPLILAAMLLVAGIALLCSGWMLRHAGVRLIDDASGFAVAQAGRVVTVLGSLVLAAGSGAVLSIAVATL